ncbi:hypothetical protein AcW2_005956 [Taiwanofungus camphoratus]|nr:hypothetical protein AcW2_005956 [Antrodia cinnamomea]
MELIAVVNSAPLFIHMAFVLPVRSRSRFEYVENRPIYHKRPRPAIDKTDPRRCKETFRLNIVIVILMVPFASRMRRCVFSKFYLRYASENENK